MSEKTIKVSVTLSKPTYEFIMSRSEDGMAAWIENLIGDHIASLKSLRKGCSPYRGRGRTSPMGDYLRNNLPNVGGGEYLDMPDNLLPGVLSTSRVAPYVAYYNKANGTSYKVRVRDGRVVVGTDVGLPGGVKPEDMPKPRERGSIKTLGGVLVVSYKQAVQSLSGDGAVTGAAGSTIAASQARVIAAINRKLASVRYGLCVGMTIAVPDMKMSGMVVGANMSGTAAGGPVRPVIYRTKGYKTPTRRVTVVSDWVFA